MALKTRSTKASLSRAYKRRRRARRVSFLAAVISLSVFVGACIVLTLALKTKRLTVAVNSSDESISTVISILSRTLAAHKVKYQLDAVRASSTPPHPFPLSVARADMLSDDMLALLVLRKINILFLGASSERISNLAALKSGRVGIVGRASDDQRLVTSLLAEQGFNGQVAYLNQPHDSDRILKEFDLIVYIGAIESDDLLDLAKVRGIKFLSMAGADAFVRRHPEFEVDEIPPGSILPGAPSEEINTVRVPYYLIATPSLARDDASRLTEAILTNRQSVVKNVGSTAVLLKPDVEKDAAIRVHPGASAYINDSERTFLEEYSDLFWGALLLLSGLGSVGAWCRAFYYRDQLDETAETRDQLLDLMKRTRVEENLFKLKELESEADRLLRQTLDRHEAGILDDSQLGAFGLALDQFRQSITSRKIDLSSLTDAPPVAPLG